MDYWKFMEHGLFGKGSARKNHKYYQRAEAETDKEKKARMKAAKKRYNKKMSAARRKRAVQKGAQRVARLLERKLTLQGK